MTNYNTSFFNVQSQMTTERAEKEKTVYILS